MIDPKLNYSTQLNDPNKNGNPSQSHSNQAPSGDLFSLNRQSKLDELRKHVLAKVNNQKPVTGNETQIPTEFLGKEPITPERFEKVFADYNAFLEKSAKTRISSFLKQCRYFIKENDKVEVELQSKLQLEQLEDEKLDMIPWFRKSLNNGNFDFIFIVNSNLIQAEKRVSKADLLKIMSDKNPLLNDFVSQLGLEIEY